jgi:hypothetical protein
MANPVTTSIPIVKNPGAPDQSRRRFWPVALLLAVLLVALVAIKSSAQGTPANPHAAPGPWPPHRDLFHSGL